MAVFIFCVVDSLAYFALILLNVSSVGEKLLDRLAPVAWPTCYPGRDLFGSICKGLPFLALRPLIWEPQLSREPLFAVFLLN